MNSSSGLWQAVVPVIDALEALPARYYIGGSVASSFTGIARFTQDADLVADLRPAHLKTLATTLEGNYYVDRERIARAIQGRRSFNAIHLATTFKVDVFVAEDSPFARESLNRRVEIHVPDLGRALYFSSAEDIVLQKLRWFTEGGGVSERQWYDLQGVLRLQRQGLDLGYLRRWAEQLGLAELLEKAFDEAGLGG
jgi:hypothetical protein